MKKFYWMFVMLMLSALSAEAQEKKAATISKISATKTGDCGATCNPITWDFAFQVVDAKGTIIDKEFSWQATTRVFCDTMELEKTSVIPLKGLSIAGSHKGEICKHDTGVFSVQTTVTLSDVKSLEVLDMKVITHN